MPVLMGIDIETYSSAPLPRCGVYRYCDVPDLEILLFSYAFDDEPVQTIDLASGETLPKEVISALEDPNIIKVAYNAQFERVCLSRYSAPTKSAKRFLFPFPPDFRSESLPFPAVLRYNHS